MGEPNDGTEAKGTRKPYEKPLARKITEEQAKLKLRGLSIEGNQGATELLELMFAGVSPKNTNVKKKSA